MNRQELLPIAKPILFNTEMVKAILEGRKTVTRRIVKFTEGRNPNWTGYIKDGLTLYNGTNEPCNKKPPFKKGDYLYVRETWQECCRNTVHSPIIHNKYYFKASIDSAYYGCIEDCGKICNWKPSIHMPKEAARIFLKVTDVRVERLQDITDAEAEKEGATPNNPLVFSPDEWPNKENFKIIWNSTIKKADLDKYGWEANPWVWVIEFERVEV